MKALFAAGTLFGAFYLRSLVLTPPADLGAAINAANYERIVIPTSEAEVEKLFGVPGIWVVDPALPTILEKGPGFDGDGARPTRVQWVKWEDPTARDRWIAVALETWEDTRGRVWTLVVAKKKNGF
jgi:hypothetical protein